MYASLHSCLRMRVTRLRILQDVIEEFQEELQALCSTLAAHADPRNADAAARLLEENTSREALHAMKALRERLQQVGRGVKVRIMLALNVMSALARIVLVLCAPCILASEAEANCVAAVS